MDPAWNPDDTDQPEILLAVNRAIDRFQDELGPQQLVFGVGIAAFQGRPVPLLLADSTRLGPYSGFVRVVPSRKDVEPPLIPIDDLIRTGAGERLIAWEMPASSVVLPVTRPQVLGGLPRRLFDADAIRGTATLMRGTTGARVQGLASPAPGFLTAGHVTGTVPGVLVERVRKRRFRQAVTEPVGEVIHASDPADTPGQAGYDAAVVRTQPGFRLVTPSRRVAQLPATIAFPHPATIHGAISGTAPAVLIGALMIYGDDKRLWKNSWTMMPSGVAVQGDSGAAVTDTTGRLLGMLVGGSAYEESTAMAVQYVQDAESTEREYLTPLNAHFG